MRKKGSLQWISSVLGKSKKYIYIMLVIQILLGGSSVLYAMIFRGIIDAAVAKEKMAFVLNAAYICGLTILQIFLRTWNRHLEEKARSSYENCLKHRLFDILLRKDYSKVSSVHSAAWNNRLTSDTVIVADGMAQILPSITGMAVKLTGAVLMIMYLEPALALILIPGGSIFLGLTYAFRRVLKRLHKNVQEKDGRLRIFIQEYMSDLMIVRAFGAEKKSTAKPDDRMADHQKARMERNHFSNLCNMGFAAVMNGAYLVGMIWCGYGILHDTVSYGTLMAVLQLISQIQTPFANITGYLPKYYAMLASAERLMEAEAYDDALNTKEKAIDEIKAFYDNELKSIELKNIFFSYLPVINDDNENDATEDMPQVLSNAELIVHKCEYLALTGYSGCGKSTLLKVLMGIYEPDSGTRTINGTIPLTYEWRRLFSYVPQGNALMSGTIRETIAFANEGSANDEKRMQQALKIACADRFVNKLKNGLDTKLGESGHGLSEGQMQRIAIARAIFSDSPILLLDEATSSLDEKTEQQLLRNLKGMTGRTVVIITHRPTVLEICDRIINFESSDDN